MKILVIFTGGTIGSSVCHGWISPDSNAKYRLLDSYKGSADVQFVTVEPYTLLSENLNARYLTTLCGVICDSIADDCDGIIVAHGTDTLHYSAAAAAFCVGCDKKPVMFVSSGHPLESDLSNGEMNFEAAVEFIRQKAGKGVYVCYENEKSGKVGIHCAARMLRHPELSDSVFSLGSTPFAVYEEGQVQKCTGFVPSTVGTPCGRVQFCDDPRLLTITVSPTENYDYDLTRYNAVMLIPYHSGTLNTDSRRFKTFCQRAKDAGIPVFVPDVGGGDPYESMRTFDRLGLTALPLSASIPISVKIWIAISINTDIKEFVIKPIAQEFL